MLPCGRMAFTHQSLGTIVVDLELATKGEVVALDLTVLAIQDEDVVL